MSPRLFVLAAACSLAFGCGGSESTTPPVGTDPLPLTSGSFAGHYDVPVDAALTAAATFDVAEVDWSVVAGVATLHYDLPVGLVGGKVTIELSGAVTAGATSATLTSELGTGTCTATARTITCHEVLADLGTLPISTLVVQQRAALEYAGPAADRLSVASVFSSDPIGNVDFDLDAPVVDDHGGGSGH